ncbi:MAG: CotH kinase family protein [Bacteroidaceae bacterium]|nr:CotH kinase family protein [Bacteroidaceae bacterium]
MRVCSLFIALVWVSAEAFSARRDTLYVYLSPERLDVYPMKLVKEVSENTETMTLTTIDDEQHVYRFSLIDSVSEYAPDSLPRLTLFKFNNKYNDQVFTDVVADIRGDTVVTAVVPSIGKWLTPSFQLSDTLARAYVDQIEQQSKRSRQCFCEPIHYTVARPGFQVLVQYAVSTELQWEPYGRTYDVNVTFPTDTATSIPLLHIATEDGELPCSKTVYVDATLHINGQGIWPDMPEVALQIKGRGNTSWSSDPTAKNPYRLKFPSGLKPFGLTRGKNWVLLANAQRGSMMTGSIGMKAAHLMGCAAANHIVPVELYFNGNYRGSYTFTEKIGIHNNSIELDDESRAVLLELDTYSDSTKFRTSAYYMPVNIKEPEFDNQSATTTLTRQEIIDDVNDFMQAVSDGEDITDLVDVKRLAAYLSLNELIGNYELMHPKSVFLYKEDLLAGSPYVFGPVWDFDWAYGYADRITYYTSGYTDNFYTSPTHTYSGGANAHATDQFWKRLRYGSEAIDRACYALWTRFMQQGGLDELLDYVDDYYQFAASSFTNNATLWRDGQNYATSSNQAKTWLRRRAIYIYSKLTPYELTADELEEPIVWQPSVASTDTYPTDIPSFIEEEPVEGRWSGSVFTLQGICVKRNASFNTWREGLARGIYIVNGHRVLVP